MICMSEDITRKVEDRMKEVNDEQSSIREKKR